MRIGNRTQAFEWYKVEWSWVTSITQISRSRYYSTSNNSKMLQCQTNRKSYWSIERRNCQWPWTTPNTVFKVTLFFDAEYLVNGQRYSHSYYGRRIGNPTQALEWYQFGWPWVTYNPDFEVTIIQRQITRKWYNIDLYLQWPTNRKSYMIYQIAPFSMTLNDPYPWFQGHVIVWRWISQKRTIGTDIVSMKY